LFLFENFQVLNGEKDLHDLDRERNEVGNKLESIENFLYNTVNYMTDFLDNQTDFSQVRQQAMQKVYKEELIEKQQKLPVEVSTEKANTEAMIQTNVNKSKSVQFLNAI
jgi:hypothetical protein